MAKAVNGHRFYPKFSRRRNRCNEGRLQQPNIFTPRYPYFMTRFINIIIEDIIKGYVFHWRKRERVFPKITIIKSIVPSSYIYIILHSKDGGNALWAFYQNIF